MSLASSISGTVTYLRGLAALALTDVGQVGSGTVTGDSGGGGTTTWVYAESVMCRIDPLGGGEQVIAERLSDRSTHLITLPPATPLSPMQRLQVTGVGTYEITAVREQTGELMRFAEAVQIA